MAGRTKVVDDLVSDVRQQLSEENTAALDTKLDILAALNRAQDYAANILARHYESPMLVKQIVELEPGRSEYPIPDDAFEQRLEKIELTIGRSFVELTRTSYRDATYYESTSGTFIPSLYVVIGNRYRLVPGPSSGARQIRIWYLRDPLPLVLQQGRVTLVNAAENYLLVDSLGVDLTTEGDNLNSYISVIDGQSGLRKGSFQIKNLVDNKIEIKTTPARSTVLNIPIDSSFNGLVDESGQPLTIEPDDYVCVVSGICIPFFKKPFSNFLIQYAVAELTRKLGGDSGMEQSVLKGLEEEVERSWVGRETTLRVKKRNITWGSNYSRWRGNT
jgi:hypothetical protein